MRALTNTAQRPLTEDDLIAAMVEALGAPPRPLRVGIGDDAAAWKVSRHHLSLLTIDMLVDGVHFRLAATTPEALGHKALAQNLSDIAAMGGWPTVAVIALGLTDQADEAWVRRLYSGIAALARSSHCAIAGGDIVRAPAITIGISVAGEVRSTQLRTRDGARPGDVISVTGPLGLGAAGLLALDAGSRRKDVVPERSSGVVTERSSGPLVKFNNDDLAAVSAAYLTPMPRLREGQYLGSRRTVRALMDISDGLSSDVRRMARASHVDAVLDAAALAPHGAVAAVATALGRNALDLVLHGGDDYELLAAVEPRAFKHVAAGFAKRFGRPLHAVGRFEKGDGEVWLERLGKRDALAPGGYDHLKRTSDG